MAAPSSAVPQWLPVVISAAAFAVAALSLGWNIYRDVVLRARVIVSFSVKWISHGDQETEDRMVLSVVNFGPGNVRFSTMVSIRNAPWWRRLLRKQQWFVITPEWGHWLNTQLPKTLEVGDEVRVVFPYDGACFLSEPVTHIGIMDSFNRYHWAPRADVREAIKQFRRDFYREGDAWKRHEVL
jgi:hypothetical protein